MFDALLVFFPTSFAMHILLGLFGVVGYLLLSYYKKTHWILYALLCWFPLESFFLRSISPEYYSYVKYIPEITLYGYGLITWFFYWQKHRIFFPKNPITPWVCGVIVLSCVTLFINWYSPVTWVLGVRQILRFVVIFFIIGLGEYCPKKIHRIILISFVMILLQVCLGLVQYLAGGKLDAYLFASGGVTLTSWAAIGEIEQFWTRGTRIFATMGRYDRLGSFLALGLIYYTAFFRQVRQRGWQHYGVFVFLFLVAALVLTYSRASWIAAVVGCVAVVVGLYRNKTVAKLGVRIMMLFLAYLGCLLVFTQTAQRIVETPTMSLTERVLEATSLRAWQESYDGAGRIFFIINTPRIVVPYAPLFGVGPGRYGGGVASVLDSREIYDRLNLPFGVQNVYGQIDNSWFSLWGELGTLGLLVYLGLFGVVAKMSYVVFQNNVQKDMFVAAVAAGCFGSVAGLLVLGFFGPYTEFRTLMCYFWTGAGIVGYYLQQQNNVYDI